MVWSCGVAENIGDTLTFWILTDDTDQLIARSVLRPVEDNNPNLRARPTHGEKDSAVLQLDSFNDLRKGSLPRFSPEELVDRTFLYPTEDPIYNCEKDK